LEEAALYYQKAYEAEPRAIYLVDILYCHFRAGAPRDEIRKRLRAISEDQLDSKRQMHVAILKAELGDMKGAEQTLLDLLRENPRFGMGHLNLGILWERMGENEKARRAYSNALTLMPNNKEAREGLEDLRRRTK
jgi:tetratricopeptide (TPR) repeat protein